MENSLKHAPHDKLKNRQGWAAWMPLGVSSKTGRTPVFEHAQAIEAEYVRRTRRTYYSGKRGFWPYSAKNAPLFAIFALNFVSFF